MKKVLSLILSLVMIMSMTTGLNLTAYAETMSGSCGDSATYSLDTETGVLTISGKGDMNDYSSSSSTPWYGVIAKINCVIVSEGITSIGKNAFYGSKSLSSVTLPITLISIGQYAFKNCEALESISIPSRVTTIGASAFSCCNSLKNISIPSSVTSIGDFAFYGCSSFDSITIPDGVTSIGGSAFYDCKGLTSITIPNSVTSIGNRAFTGCSGLTSITVDSNNTIFDSRDNCNAIIETATNTLVTGCQNTVIPNDITIIGDSAFYGCSNLTKILIPNGVTIIDNSAFNSCNSLKSISIPSSVVSIKKYVFDYCYGLTSMTVDSNNTVYDSRDNCNAIIETATNTLVRGCQNTVIPNDVTIISGDAFYGCGSLARILIPSSVTTICSYAFYKCTDLTDVYFTGTEDEWKQITIEKSNDALTNATLHFNHIHSYSDVVTPATCTEKGYTTHTCTECGASYVDSYVNATGHKYTDVVTPATCTTQGYTTHTCSVCGDSYVDTYVDATGHNFGNNSPTCLICGAANPNYVAPAPAPTPAPVQPTVTQPATTTAVKKPKATSIKKS